MIDMMHVLCAIVSKYGGKAEYVCLIVLVLTAMGQQSVNISIAILPATIEIAGDNFTFRLLLSGQ